MKKIISASLALTLCILLFVALSACNGVDFSDLQIVAEDVSAVPEGEYTLQYSIKDYEKFRKEFNLTVTVRVYDESQNAVEVENNRTIKVGKGKKYSVNVLCSAEINGEIKNVIKVFTVTAEPKPPEIKFFIGETLWKNHTITVEYGSSLDISEIYPVPDLYNSRSDGYKEIITSKKWVVYVNGQPEDLNSSHLENITGDLFIRSVYTYRLEVIKPVLTYNANGGFLKGNENNQEISVSTLQFDQTIYMPENPIKEGYIFDGWYEDENFTKLFDWTVNKRISIRRDITLRAKWLKDENADWIDKYEFEKKSLNGYDYYEVKFIGDIPDDGAIKLPAGKDNIPVRGLSSFAFAGKDIRSITIPARYDLNMYRAFQGCQQLQTVIFEENSQVTYIDNYAFSNCTALSSISLPEGIHTVSIGAFKNCSSLSKVVLPETLQILQEEAFIGCSSLTEIALPDNLSKIYRNAFRDCSSLTTVKLNPESTLSYMSGGIFEGTAIEEITLPYVFSESDSLFPENSGVKVSYFPELKEEATE